MKKILYIAALALCTMYVQAQELFNYPLDTINGEEVYRYRVEKSIGLYRIGVNFNVSQNEIIRLNPQLRERGLHFDEILYIPTGRPVTVKAKETPKQKVEVKQAVEEKPKVEEKVETKVEEKVEAKPFVAAPIVVTPEPTVTVVEEEPQEQVVEAPEPEVLDTIVNGRRVIEYALMLPFESQQTKRSPTAARMLEFYQGALLALHDLQNDSILYRLRVYDVERSDRRVKALCDSTELDRVQGIIGLAYPIQIERMAKWCDEHQVPLLVPFSDNIDLAKHPSVMQFNSTDRQESDSLCRWIAQKGDSTLHCVAIEVKEADLSNSTRELRKAMDANGLSYSLLPMRDLMNDSVDYALDSTKENLIIVHSDRFQHLRVLLPHLTKMQDAGYRIRLMSQYAWQKENLSLPQVYTNIFASDLGREDYDALWSQWFVNEHVGEMPRYDLLGYDLTRSLIEWQQGSYDFIGLQSFIHWQQEGEGGWQNTEVMVVETGKLKTENEETTVVNEPIVLED